MLTRLERKLRSELGAPAPVPVKDPPAKDPPPKDAPKDVPKVDEGGPPISPTP